MLYPLSYGRLSLKHRSLAGFGVWPSGAGWMAVQTPDGSEAYTRNGSFELNVNGVLQTRNGLPVQGDGGPISIPPDVKVSVGVDGTISVVPESGAQNIVNVVGRVKLVNPPDADLVRGEDGLFRLKDGGTAPVDERARVVCRDAALGSAGAGLPA